MRNRFLAGIALVGLITPIIALAAFLRPSDVLFTMFNEQGKPRSFESKIYAKTDMGGEDLQLFATLSGMTEGTKLANAKAMFHTDFSVLNNGGQSSLAGSADMMVVNRKIYVRIPSLTLTGDFLPSENDGAMEVFNRDYRGKWFMIDPATDTESLSWSDISWSDITELSDAGIAPETLKDGVARVIDAIFRMSNERFKGGNTYTLTLKRDFLTSAVRALEQWSAENDPSLASGLSADDPSLEEMEQLIADAFTLRLKVDTSNEEDFRFAKYFAKLDMQDAGIFFSMEGKMQHRMQPVYLQIPANAPNLETYAKSHPITPAMEEEDWTPPSLEDDFAPVEDSLPAYNQWNRYDCSSATLSELGANRRGSCPIQRTSRRNLREQVRWEQENRVR